MTQPVDDEWFNQVNDILSSMPPIPQPLPPLQKLQGIFRYRMHGFLSFL